VKHFRPSVDWIVFILTLGLVASLLIYAAGVLYEVVAGHRLSEVPPNSSQILTVIFSGLIGIVGSYVGYSEASDRHDDGNDLFDRHN